MKNAITSHNLRVCLKPYQSWPLAPSVRCTQYLSLHQEAACLGGLQHMTLSYLLHLHLAKAYAGLELYGRTRCMFMTVEKYRKEKRTFLRRMREMNSYVFGRRCRVCETLNSSKRCGRMSSILRSPVSPLTSRSPRCPVFHLTINFEVTLFLETL